MLNDIFNPNRVLPLSRSTPNQTDYFHTTCIIGADWNLIAALCLKEGVVINQRRTIHHLGSDLVPECFIPWCNGGPLVPRIIRITGIILKLPLRLCPCQAVGNVCEIRLGVDNGERFAVDLVDRPACIVICPGSDGWAYPGDIKGGAL
jgi:hypothetical protein